MNTPLKIFGVFITALLIFPSCNSHTEPAAEEALAPAVSQVKVAAVQDGPMSEYVEFSAVSVYLEKSFVKANINGYVQRTDVKTGQAVHNGQLLFRLITKEARSIGNAVNALDPAFKFSGISNIRAGQSGTIIQVNHQKDDYVQDGEALATISNRNSLVFLLDLPYEFNQLVSNGKALDIVLPDGTKVTGNVTGTMPSVDSLAQTQRYILKVTANKDIPEGLIAKVKLVKTNHPNTQLLPKSAVLSNETEEEFWVMKLINDTTAVKIKVKKGMENSTQTEVLEPKFEKGDRILISGNYGIADTAKVNIQR